MFPSGHWRGFYEQPGAGRQWMEPLTLAFDGGDVRGEGRDIVGPFTFQGKYSGGNVRLLKQYQGRHQLVYQGQIEGEGTIVGRWSIGDWLDGPFVLMAAREAAASLPIAEAVFGE